MFKLFKPQDARIASQKILKLGINTSKLNLRIAELEEENMKLQHYIVDKLEPIFAIDNTTRATTKKES